MRRKRSRKPASVQDERDLWKVSLLRTFAAKHGLHAIKRNTIVPPGVRLENYVFACRLRYRRDRMPHWLASELESIPGWTWDPIGDRHKQKIEMLRTFMRWSGHDADFIIRIGEWILARGTRHRQGMLGASERKELARIPGWQWR